MPLLKKYKLNITWGDQDLLNIIFSHNPGKHLCILFLLCSPLKENSYMILSKNIKYLILI